MKTSGVSAKSAVSPTDGVSVGAGSDSTTYTGQDVLCGLYVGSTGDVKVDTFGGTTLTFENVPTGAFIPLRITKVYATDTTASSIIGLQE